MKEFEKIVPAIKKQMKQVQETFSKIDTKEMQNKVQQATNYVKKRVQDLKQSSKNNEISIQVNNKDAQKQIFQVQKQIDSLQEKINARQMKLNIINPQIDKIVDDTRKSVTPEGINPNDKAMDTTVNNALGANKDFTSLNSQAQKLYTEIEMYNKQLSEAKRKMAQLDQQTSKTAATQNKLGSFFGTLKSKIEPVKAAVGRIGTAFKNVGSSIGRCLNPVNLIKKGAGAIENVVKNIGTKAKGVGTGIKSGIGTVLKYAAALFSLRSIYSTLSGCAQSWLSSQNAGAKQLSANIDYMKYSMGSALAPVIQFVTNLVYQLMKAIQSVAYALTGVNIFAKASASSYASMAGSAKKAKNETKQLAGIHDEINNIQSSNNSDSGSGGSTSPSFDLSQMDNIPNGIIDAIKNGNWYEVGSLIGQKLNEAMENIPWDKIQNTAKTIATNIGQFINGFTDGFNWTLLGNTIGNGINTAFLFANTLLTTINWGNIGTSIANFLNSSISTIDWNQIGQTFSNILNAIFYLGFNFVTTFDWQQFGKAISDAINGFFNNVDWAVAAETLSEGIKGILSTISTTLENIDWQQLAKDLEEFVTNIDWSGIAQGIFRGIGAALGGLAAFLGTLISDAFTGIGDYFNEKIEECGGNIVEGIFKGIGDAIANIGQWIYDNIFAPFIDGFKSAFGIHSPSKVMSEQGNFIVQGLFNGITNLVGKITEIWNRMKATAVKIFSNIKTSIVNKVTEIKNGISQKFQDAYNSIRNIFGNIGNFFSGIWNGVKNTFSNLGTSIGNAISGAVKSGINGVISLIEKTINSAIRLINGGINLINLIPGVTVGTINTLSLPRLAKGGVLTEATTVLAGEYSGAKTNPEIVTPQNIMRDTFEDVLSKYSGSNNDRPIYLTVNVGNQKLGQILLEDLRDRTRRTGKDIEALVGG